MVSQAQYHVLGVFNHLAKVLKHIEAVLQPLEASLEGFTLLKVIKFLFFASQEVEVLPVGGGQEIR